MTYPHQVLSTEQNPSYTVLTFRHDSLDIHTSLQLLLHLPPQLPPACLALRTQRKIHKGRNLLITQIVPMALPARHNSPMHKRPGSHLRRPPNRPLHGPKHLPQRPTKRAVQLRPIAEARIDNVDHDRIVGGETSDKLPKEKREEQLGSVVTILSAELGRVVQHTQHALIRLGRYLALFERRPLRHLATHDTQNWGRGRCAVLGGEPTGAAVLGLQNRPQQNRQERGAEPVGLDGEFVPVDDSVIEERDAGVEEAEINLEVRCVAHTLRKRVDAGVICHVEGPDFDRGREVAAAAAAAGLFEGAEQGVFGCFAFCRVADSEDEMAESEGEELRGGMVAEARVGACDDASFTGQ